MGIGNLVDEEKAPGYEYGRKRDGMKTSLEDQDSSFFFPEDFDEESNRLLEDDDNRDGYDNSLYDPMERILFWESQEALLLEVLERYNQTGAKLRQEVSRILVLAKERNSCNCLKPSSDGCFSCLRQRVVNLLCQRGFKATICTSKWSHTTKFPGGKHDYIEVIASTSGRKKQVPYLVELEFRDQFTIVKACSEYQKLISQLPEYYIGKADCLGAIVRVLCSAARQSMKEKNLHMGPWRKRSFMQMKWSNSLNRRSADEEAVSDGVGMTTFSSSGQQVHDPILHFSATPAVVVT